MKYYFTYGTDGQPFVGGWTEVEAQLSIWLARRSALSTPTRSPAF